MIHNFNHFFYLQDYYLKQHNIVDTFLGIFRLIFNNHHNTIHKRTIDKCPLEYIEKIKQREGVDSKYYQPFGCKRL